MKTKYWLIICAACLLLGAGITELINWKYFPCETGTITATPGPEQKPIINTNSGLDNYYCGKTINIIGAMSGDNIFTVTAQNNCMFVHRDFEIKYICPSYNYHVVQLGYGPLYDIPSKQFRHSVDAMYFYSWKYFALGAGALAVFDKIQLYDIGPRVALQFRISSK
jgi:hypothetical protein